jgi:hypothetical protein
MRNQLRLTNQAEYRAGGFLPTDTYHPSGGPDEDSTHSQPVICLPVQGDSIEVKYGYACCNKRSQDFWRKFSD